MGKKNNNNKIKRKGEREQGMSIHSVASAFTLVLGIHGVTSQLKHTKAEFLAYCPRVNHSHQVATASNDGVRLANVGRGRWT